MHAPLPPPGPVTLPLDTTTLRVALDVLNQVHEIEKKLARLSEPNSIDRNVRKIREAFERDLLAPYGLEYHSPIGEGYDETKTDCDATIAGDSTEDLVITEVVKPLVRIRLGGSVQLLQKAVVIVEARPPADASPPAAAPEGGTPQALEAEPSPAPEGGTPPEPEPSPGSAPATPSPETAP